MIHALRRPLAAVVLCLLTLLGASTVLGAVPAQAQAPEAMSAYDLELWLGEHGFPGAWLMWDDAVTDAGPGVTFTLNFDSDAPDAAAFDAQARTAAQEVWQRADYRVERVIVYVRSPTSWSAPGLPAAVVFERPELETAFGARPLGLDAQGQGDLEAEFNGEFTNALGPGVDLSVGYVVLGLALAVFGGAVGWLVTFLVMRHRHAARTWGPWGPVGPGPVGPGLVGPGLVGPGLVGPGPYVPTAPGYAAPTPAPYAPYGQLIQPSPPAQPVQHPAWGPAPGEWPPPASAGPAQPHAEAAGSNALPPPA